MDLEKEILSNITVHMKYAKYVAKKERRETWGELVTRNKNMHIKTYPELKDEIMKCTSWSAPRKSCLLCALCSSAASRLR